MSVAKRNKMVGHDHRFGELAQVQRIKKRTNKALLAQKFVYFSIRCTCIGQMIVAIGRKDD